MGGSAFHSCSNLKLVKVPLANSDFECGCDDCLKCCKWIELCNQKDKAVSKVEQIHLKLEKFIHRQLKLINKIKVL
jgi:hypothetical protein